MKRIAFTCLCAIVLASCTNNSAGYKQLQSENENLRAEKIRTAYDMEAMIATLNDIYSDIQALRAAENYLVIEPSGELSVDKQTQIRNNIRQIGETLQSNRKRLADLEEKLKNGNTQSAALQKTIERLTAEINQKAQMVASLQEELAKKDIRIRELDEQMENLTLTTYAQARRINEQDMELHMAYYCFGTKKELKEQDILTGGGLFAKTKALQGNFNRDYFLTTDTREFSELQLYTGKAKLRSSHPVHSYKFTKDRNGNLTLVVTEPELFWSMSRYLVIEVG